MSGIDSLRELLDHLERLEQSEFRGLSRLMTTLTDEQLARFARRGYIIVKDGIIYLSEEEE